ncbi:CGNR zinc finger domain-containing protein [Streptomyces yerevanensis]|uniref:CGNR zinc finger domain-containing protein n=1 Tax=Streptomyces yerevanensis TaxID=66378 RepID=UPI00068E1C0B|nr:CGNR zinc finger domain-containing protein [Streptomyces yerevanensis]
MEKGGQGDSDIGATHAGSDGNDRYGIAMAPGELRIVQDLLNTASIPKAGGDVPDLLDAPDTAARWLGAYGIAGDSPGVSDLRTLRDAIRRSLVERDHDPDRDDDAGPAVVESVVRVRFEADGTVRFVPGSVGIPALGQRVLLAIYDAQRAGTWRRLKLCRNPLCAVAFWDSSRNTSGVWHDVRTCGNVANLRKSRARRGRPGRNLPTS